MAKSTNQGFIYCLVDSLETFQSFIESIKNPELLKACWICSHYVMNSTEYWGNILLIFGNS